MIYVCHPFSGNEEANRELGRLIASRIFAITHEPIIYPCDCVRYMEVEYVPYETVMDVCVELMLSCDKVVLTGDWKHSRGCIIEAANALKHGLSIQTYSNGEFYDVPENFKDILNDLLVRYCVSNLNLKHEIGVL